MARRTQLAAQRQLKRERAHLQWLEQHLAQSKQLSLSNVRIAELALQCAALSDSKQKSAAGATLINYAPLCTETLVSKQKIAK